MKSIMKTAILIGMVVSQFALVGCCCVVDRSPHYVPVPMGGSTMHYGPYYRPYPCPYPQPYYRRGGSTMHYPLYRERSNQSYF